jgi:hypothetical protein
MSEQADTIDLFNEELPAAGVTTGKIAGVDVKEKKDKRGKPYKAVVLRIQLGAKDSSDKPFVVEKSYPLNKKGKDRLAELAAELRGTQEPLTKEQLAKFKTAEFEGKEVQVTVVHAVEDGRSVAEAGPVKAVR